MTLAFSVMLAVLVWFSMNAEVSSEGATQSGKGGNNSGDKGGEIAALADRCSTSVGEDGFGDVIISNRLTISNESGEIPVPCRVRLGEGGWLQLNNVKLTSQHLSISDYRPNGETRVVFNNSDLIASGRHGFLLQLSDAADSVSMNNTDLDYPLSVWVRISDLSPNAEIGGGRIQVNNSSVRAADPESEDGIQFVTGEVGGKAKFSKVVLDTGEPQSEYQNALLFAGECEVHQVEGFPNRCGPRAILNGLEEDVQ